MVSSIGQASLRFGNNCKASELYPEFITKEESALVTKPCKSNLINSVSCQAPNVQDFVDECGGLDFTAVQAKPLMNPALLPRFIPVADERIFDLRAVQLPFNQVGISLKDLFKSTPRPSYGRLHWSGLKMQDNILSRSLFRDKQKILFLSGKDLLIESIDQDEAQIGFYDTLAKMGFELISSFNFSVFFGECALDHAINQQRSLESFRQLQERGINAIPHFYWAHELHSKKILKFILDQQIKIISVNCQCFRVADYPTIESGLKFLAEQTGGRLHFLLEGPKPALLARIKDISPLVHVAMKWPIMEAIYHNQLNFAGDHIEQIKHTVLPSAYLVGHNTREYEKYLLNCFWDKVSDQGKIAIPQSHVIKSKIDLVTMGEVVKNKI